jgi:hypothetical protein
MYNPNTQRGVDSPPPESVTRVVINQRLQTAVVYNPQENYSLHTAMPSPRRSMSMHDLVRGVDRQRPNPQSAPTSPVQAQRSFEKQKRIVFVDENARFKEEQFENNEGGAKLTERVDFFKKKDKNDSFEDMTKYFRFK